MWPQKQGGTKIYKAISDMEDWREKTDVKEFHYSRGGGRYWLIRLLLSQVSMPKIQG